MQRIIYIKKTNEYDEVLKKKHSKMPEFFKKMIFYYKNIFNIITKKNNNEADICILPINGKSSNLKTKSLIYKLKSNKKHMYVMSNDLNNKEIYKYMDELNLNYLQTIRIKKILIIKILEYIHAIQKKQIDEAEITILVNDVSDINIYLIEMLAKNVKSIKIVSLNIYKFKKLEDNLYNQYRNTNSIFK